MQVGNFILSPRRSAWDLSDMTGKKTLRGNELLDALMRLKPADLAPTTWAIESGLNRSFFSNLKDSDSAPRTDTLRKVLGYIGATEADLYEAAEGSSLTATYRRIQSRNSRGLAASSDSEVVQIQKLDLSLSMGPGTLIDGYVESELVSFDLGFVRQFSRAPSDRLRIVTGVGDSMEPTLFRNDLIVIDTNDRRLSKQDGIYWINLYGAAGIKRLRAIGPNRILVKSDNPIHDDQEVDADDLRIEGRAIWTTRGL